MLYYFYTRVQVTEVLALQMENFPVSAFKKSSEEWMKALWWLGTSRLKKCIMGKAKYLLYSLSIKVGGLARSSWS